MHWCDQVKHYLLFVNAIIVKTRKTSFADNFFSKMNNFTVRDYLLYSEDPQRMEANFKRAELFKTVFGTMR